MNLVKLIAAGCLATFAATAAWADDSWASRDYDFASRQLDDFITGHQRDLVNPVSRGLRKQGRPTPHAARSPIVVPERKPQVPQAMAAKYPPAERARMEQVFRRLLAGYEQIERQHGLPRRDLAGAVAAFLACSYVAYRDIDFPDPHFAPLVEQMRSILADDPALARASTTVRQEMYEQLAITGMFMATMRVALKQRPDPEAAQRVRAMGKGSLEQFLKTDASRVQFTAQGVVLR